MIGNSLPVQVGAAQAAQSAQQTNPEQGQQPEQPRNIPSNGRDSLRTAPGDTRTNRNLHARYAETRSRSRATSVSSTVSNASTESTESTSTRASSISPADMHVTGHQQVLNDMANTIAGIGQHLDDADVPPTSRTNPPAGGHNMASLTNQINDLTGRIQNLDQQVLNEMNKNQHLQNELQKLQEQKRTISDRLGTTASEQLVNGVDAFCKMWVNGSHQALKLIM